MLANLQFWSFFSLRSDWFVFLNLPFVIHSNRKTLSARNGRRVLAQNFWLIIYLVKTERRIRDFDATEKRDSAHSRFSLLVFP